MRIEFYCSHCQAVVKAQEEQAGRIVRCPKCRRTFQLVLLKRKRAQKFEKSTKKRKKKPTPVVKLGGIFIIDNTGSSDIGKITDVKSGELPFKLPTDSAKKPVLSKESPPAAESDLSTVVKEPQLLKAPQSHPPDAPIAAEPAFFQPMEPEESAANGVAPEVSESDADRSEVGILDLPKFDLSAFENQPPEFDDSVETPAPVALDESKESAALDDLGSADDSAVHSTASGDDNSPQLAGKSPEPAAEVKPVEKAPSTVPVPNSEMDENPSAKSDAQSSEESDQKPFADPFMAASAPISMPSVERDSKLLSHLITGLIILAGTVAVIMTGLWLFDSKGRRRGDSMAEYQRMMEIAAKDPAGPFQTTTEMIDGKMRLTHESEEFLSKSVDFDDMRIDIERLRDEEFPDALIQRYVGADTNSDGFVDEKEREKLLQYKGNEKFGP